MRASLWEPALAAADPCEPRTAYRQPPQRDFRHGRHGGGRRGSANRYLGYYRPRDPGVGGGQVVVLMEGPLPIPDAGPLRTELEKQGVAPSEVRIELDPVRVITFD